MTSTEKLTREMDRLRDAMDHHAIVEAEVMDLRKEVATLRQANITLWQSTYGDIVGLARPDGPEFSSRSGT